MMYKSIRKLVTYFMTLCLTLTLTPYAWAQQDSDVQAAAQYLAKHEPELQQITSSNKKLFLLLSLAPAALAANEVEKARAYAQKLLALGESQKSQPGFGPSLYGDATHVGNLVLGLIALKANDVVKAKEHLLAAGNIPGSSSLKSFGPNMMLAKELIERGEREVAVEYFDLCAKFWEKQNKLAQWEIIVKQGDTPDFGYNLTTSLFSWRYAR
jgi:hypothetical protein